MDFYDYHIAFFTNTYKPFVGGVAMSSDLYQRFLRELGNHVVVYAPAYDEAEEDGEEVRRLPSIRHFNHTDFSLPLPISFKPLIDFNSEAFDIVHVHHPFLLGETGMRMARQHRLPLVFTYHTQYEQYTHYVPVSHDTAARTVIRHSVEFCNLCDLIIAPTRDIHAQLAERGVTTRIEVLPTGIDMSRFYNADENALRQELGISSEAPLLIHVGRLAREKNLVFLLKACLKVLEQKPDAHLAVAGDGQMREELEGIAREAGPAGERVHLLHTRSGQDWSNFYSAGDLFVFASKSETQGMVIAEAMAAGNPAIALEANGVRDIIEDGVNGRMLPGDADEQAFADAVVEALNNPERLAEWSTGARRTAQNFDMMLLAQKLHRHYATLKLLPNAKLKTDIMSFGLIRSFFETVWEDIENWFTRA